MCITKMTCISLAWMISSMLTLLPGKSFASCLTVAKLETVTAGVVRTESETRCYISLHSPDKRQVVAEFFNMAADCTTKSDITIYDGPEENEQQIDKFCQKDPISYASRNHSLVIFFKEGDREGKPFFLNVYLINTTKIYRDSVGSIKSVRFQGRCSGTICAPNNLHSIYEVDSPVNVTFHMRFVEFNIRTITGGGCSGHYLTTTANGRTSEQMCGDGRMPDDVYVKTTNLRLDFYTGSKNAYSGFTSRFSVCREEVYGNDSHGVFELPLFRRADAVALTCAFIMHVGVKSMVTLNMTFAKSRYCNELTVNADGDRNITSIIGDCKEHFMDIEASHNITILFVAPSDQTLTVNYSVENIDDEGRATSSNIADEGSTDSHIQGNISGNATFNSTDNEEFQKKEPTKEGAGSHITSIAGAIGGAIFIVVLVIVIVLVHRRKRHRGVDKPSKGKESRNDANIYSDNQDYDVMNIKRSHKTQPEKNVYGTTSTPSDVYAMTDRSGNDRMMEMSNEYDHQYFGNTYAETSTVVQTKAQRNQPNADEYGQHDFESTYTETSTSAQKRRQNTADSKDTITDEYEQQDFGAYATTSTSTRKNEPKENFYE